MEEEKRLKQKFIAKLNALFDTAKSSHPTKEFKTFQEYYMGSEGADTPFASNTTNSFTGSQYSNYNVIKPIIETQVTMVLDSNIEPQVIPNVVSMADFENLETAQDIADIYNDILNHVLKINNFDSIKEMVVRSGDKFGVGIVDVSWDPSMAQGLGDFKITVNSVMNFFIEPTANKIEDANYIFINRSFSPLTLKMKYPDMIEDIDKILNASSSSSNEISPDDQQQMNNQSGPIVSLKTDQTVSQLYGGGDNKALDNLKKNIEVKYAFLKDDSIFITDSDSSQEDIEDNDKMAFKYPNGRMVVYAKDVILEDRAIDYPFGFPFTSFNWLNIEGSFWGQGTIRDLKEVQDRINRAYNKIKDLIQTFVSIIVIPPLSGIAEGDRRLTNSPSIMADVAYTPDLMPQVLTNNTLSQLTVMESYLQMLINSAMDIARVNKMMMSGERPVGVSSGDMVDSLNESPMTSIRSVQRNLANFVEEVAKKIIKMVPLYYNTDRIVRLSSGKKFAAITPSDEYSQGEVKIFEQNRESRTYQLVNTIKGDLSICDFEVEVVSGTQMPRTRSSSANLALQLYGQGILGDPNSVSTKSYIIDMLDLPNKNSLKDRMEVSLNEAKQIKPDAGRLVDKIQMSFKDLPLEAQAKVLSEIGALDIMGTPPDITQMPPMQ